MTCDKTSQLQAYYDDELDPAQREALEAHMAQCEACSALLRDLKGLSRLFNEVPLPELPAGALARFKGAIRPARDRGILRLASWMTAAAAAVLLFALLDRRTTMVEPPRGAAAWEATALIDATTPPPQYADAGDNEMVQFAQWMADDLSTGQRR